MSLSPLADPGPDPELLAHLLSSAAPKAVRQRASFFVFFAETVYPEIAQHRRALAGLYAAHNGRPAWEPIRLLGMLLLQFVERYPDRQAAEAMQFDARWRVALHLQPGEVACDPSLLSVFRQRLLTGGCERLGFEAALALVTVVGCPATPGNGWIPRMSVGSSARWVGWNAPEKRSGWSWRRWMIGWSCRRNGPRRGIATSRAKSIRAAPSSDSTPRCWRPERICT